MSTTESTGTSGPATATRIAVFDPNNPTTTLLAVNMSNITRLTNTNYLMWSRQIHALLEGHELHSFLQKSDTTPTPTIVIEGVDKPNPAYTPWCRQDRLLYSAMIGAISVAVQPLVATASTTHDIWSTLAEIYATPTRGHIKQIRFHIANMVKGTNSIVEYMRIVKSKSDELALLGKPMDAEELIERVLHGLPEDYKSEIDMVNGRDHLISFSELTEKLLNREAMLICAQPQTPLFPVMANITTRSNNNRGTWRSSFTPRHNNNNGHRQPRP